MAGGEPPTTVREFEFDPTSLREITPKQQSVYKALMALVLRHGAADFHHGHAITPASIAAQSIDDHHIFPRAFLNPPEAEPTRDTQLVDCILNRTLIDADTNRRIGKRAPREYLSEIEEELSRVSDDAFAQVLSSHLLPVNEGSPLQANDFDGFLSWRESRFADEISAVTGTGARAGAANGGD